VLLKKEADRSFPHSPLEIDHARNIRKLSAFYRNQEK